MEVNKQFEIDTCTMYMYKQCLQGKCLYREGDRCTQVTGIRLDIANAVVKLTQFSDKQSEACQKAEKRIYRYLKGYRDIVMGKLFKRIQGFVIPSNMMS